MRVAEFMGSLDQTELGQLAGAVVLAVGMTPDVVVAVPKPVEGTSWRPCYERGIERLSHPAELV